MYVSLGVKFLLKTILIVYNIAFGTLKGTLTVPIEKTCWLRLFSERIAVYFERHSERGHGVDKMYDV